MRVHWYTVGTQGQQDQQEKRIGRNTGTEDRQGANRAATTNSSCPLQYLLILLQLNGGRGVEVVGMGWRFLNFPPNNSIQFNSILYPTGWALIRGGCQFEVGCFNRINTVIQHYLSICATMSQLVSKYKMENDGLSCLQPGCCFAHETTFFLCLESDMRTMNGIRL